MAFFAVYAYAAWTSAKAEPRSVGDTQPHNERIYRDFEFFIKVFLAIGAAFGYVRLRTEVASSATRQLILLMTAAGMLTMWALGTSIIAHQASKIRRWKEPRIQNWLQWQEPWLILAMWLLASGFWIWAPRI
jgi:hypothetical protein